MESAHTVGATRMLLFALSLIVVVIVGLALGYIADSVAQ